LFRPPQVFQFGRHVHQHVLEGADFVFHLGRRFELAVLVGGSGRAEVNLVSTTEATVRVNAATGQKRLSILPRKASPTAAGSMIELIAASASKIKRT